MKRIVNIVIVTECYNPKKFTQHELSTLLGWEEATLNRYENGSLQEDSHDRLLKFAMEHFLQLITNKPGAIAPEKRAILIERLIKSARQKKPLNPLSIGDLQGVIPLLRGARGV